jgi:hypothetical protein
MTDHFLYYLSLARITGLELLLDCLGRIGKQSEQMMPWYVRAKPDAKGKYVIGSGTFDQCRNSGIGKLCAAVLSGPAHNFLIAALDKDVGDNLRKCLAFRDREQMELTFGLCPLDQSIVVKPVRFREDWASNVYRIIECQRTARVDRGVRERGKSRAKGDPRQLIHLFCESSHHIVEELNLVIRKRHRPRRKQVGNPTQRLDPMTNGFLRNCVFQFFD